MLETFIIDDERGRERRRREERPTLELPLPEPQLDRPPRKTDTDDEKPQRRVVVIDLLS